MRCFIFALWICLLFNICCAYAQKHDWNTIRIDSYGTTWETAEFPVYLKNNTETRGFIQITDDYIKFCIIFEDNFIKIKDYEQVVINLVSEDNNKKHKIFAYSKNNKIWIDKLYYNNIDNPHYFYIKELKTSCHFVVHMVTNNE